MTAKPHRFLENDDDEVDWLFGDHGADRHGARLGHLARFLVTPKPRRFLERYRGNDTMSGDFEGNWGPEVVVDGKRPEWLEEGRTRVLKHHSRYAMGWQELPAEEVNWETADMFRLPADHPFYAQKVEEVQPDPATRAIEICREIAARGNWAGEIGQEAQAIVADIDKPEANPAINWNGPLEAYHPDGRTQEVTEAYPSGSPNSDYVLKFSRPPATDCPYGFQANGSPYVGSMSQWRVRNVVGAARTEINSDLQSRKAATTPLIRMLSLSIPDDQEMPSVVTVNGVRFERFTEAAELDALAQDNAKIRKLKRKLRKARATIERNAAFADSKIDEMADKLAEARTYTPEQEVAAREELVFAERRCLLPEQIVASLAVKFGLRKAPSAAQKN